MLQDKNFASQAAVINVAGAISCGGDDESNAATAVPTRFGGLVGLCCAGFESMDTLADPTAPPTGVRDLITENGEATTT